MNLASPCIHICKMDLATGLCTGCKRTLNEIAEWSQMDEVRKAKVWAALPVRISQNANEVEKGRGGVP